MQALNELLNESYLVSKLNIKETNVKFSQNLQKVNEILTYVLNKLKETVNYQNYKSHYADVEDDFEYIIIKSLMFNKRTLRNFVDKYLHRSLFIRNNDFYDLESNADNALILRIIQYYIHKYKSSDIIVGLINNSSILIEGGDMREVSEVFFDEKGILCYKIDAVSCFKDLLRSDYQLFNERKNTISKINVSKIDDYGTFLEKRQESFINGLLNIVTLGLPLAHKLIYVEMLNENPELKSILDPCYEFDMEVEI